LHRLQSCGHFIIPMLGREQYEHWLDQARRHARRAGEAEDLLHNAMLAAISAGRSDLSDPAAAAWFGGVMRNLGTMEARSAARRKAREANHAPAVSDPVEESPADELDAWLRSIGELPRAARAVAVLALAGLTREEIAFVLRINQTALRQRLATVRRAWANLDTRPAGVPRPRSTYRTQLEIGLLRRALLNVLQHRGGGIGTHDPDGHLIVLANDQSQIPAWRQRKPGRKTNRRERP
jgi:RNA polymerase sigma-70 factor (ECF subfamily)